MTQESVSIRSVFLSALLFLPLCFFLWFVVASALVMPVKGLLSLVLTAWQPDLFNGVTQFKYLLSVETLIFPSQTFAGQGDKLAVLDVSVNPMIYGYGLAVLSGLVLSLNSLSMKQKAFQIILGYLLVVLIQVNGCFWECLKHLVFNAGNDAQMAILDTGLSSNVIALLYQMSYLIFPAILPVVLWIIMNLSFISEITGFQVKSDRNFSS